MQAYFVRIGSWGDVALCRAAAGHSYRRGRRVICRTPRGLEIGEVTGRCEATDADRTEATATIVRRTSPEDELLLSRLEKYRRQAIADCRRSLQAAGSTATLLDVDQMFDAGTLVFYFLDPPDQRETDLVQQLAEQYESRVRNGHFAKLLASGCGPGCGERDCGDEGADADQNSSAAAGGKRSGGCSGSCAICVVAKQRR